MKTVKRKPKEWDTPDGRIPTQDPALKVRFYDDPGADVPCEVLAYLHCGQCLDEWKASRRGEGPAVSPRDYARLEIGWTKGGLQVRCVRHDLNVVNVVVRAERVVASLVEALNRLDTSARTTPETGGR